MRPAIFRQRTFSKLKIIDRNLRKPIGRKKKSTDELEKKLKKAVTGRTARQGERKKRVEGAKSNEKRSGRRI